MKKYLNLILICFTLSILSNCSSNRKNPFSTDKYVIEDFKLHKADSNSVLLFIPIILSDSIITIKNDSMCTGADCRQFTFDEKLNQLTVEEEKLTIRKVNEKLELISLKKDTLVIKPL